MPSLVIPEPCAPDLQHILPHSDLCLDERSLGFCCSNAFLPWLRGWGGVRTSPGSNPSASLSPLQRTAWEAGQHIRLCRKSWQFKFTWRTHVGKKNQFQISVIALVGNERRRTFQQLPTWVEQCLWGVPGFSLTLKAHPHFTKKGPSMISEPPQVSALRLYQKELQGLRGGI